MSENAKDGLLNGNPIAGYIVIQKGGQCKVILSGFGVEILGPLTDMEVEVFAVEASLRVRHAIRKASTKPVQGGPTGGA